MAIDKKQSKQAFKVTATQVADKSLDKMIIDTKNLPEIKNGNVPSKFQKTGTKVKKKSKGIIGKAESQLEKINKKAEKITGLKPKDDNKIRFSAWYVIDQVISLQLLFLLGITLIIGIIIISGDIRPYILPIALILLCVFLFIDLSWSFLIIYQGKNSYYEILSKEIIYHNKGFFFKRTINYSVGAKTEFMLRQGIRGMLLHFGTIRISDPNFPKPIRMRRISKPNSSIEKLESLKLNKS